MTEKNTQPGESGAVHNNADAQQNDAFRTPIEQAVGVARDQAGAAADALRRGEFMHEATVDPMRPAMTA